MNELKLLEIAQLAKKICDDPTDEDLKKQLKDYITELEKEQ